MQKFVNPFYRSRCFLCRRTSYAEWRDIDFRLYM